MTKKPKRPSVGERIALGLLDAIDAKRQELLKDPRARADYWNGDSWGSRFGSDNAVTWLQGELVHFVAVRLNTVVRRAVRKRDSDWIAALAKWSHVQPTIESHRMIVKTMRQQMRSPR